MPQMKVQIIASISNFAQNSTCGRVMAAEVNEGTQPLASEKFQIGTSRQNEDIFTGIPPT